MKKTDFSLVPLDDSQSETARVFAAEHAQVCPTAYGSWSCVTTQLPCGPVLLPVHASDNLWSVKKVAQKSQLQVGLLSPHPLVLSEFERVLKNPAFKLISHQLGSMLGPDLRHLEIPKASVYVVDAHVARPAAGALLANILDHNPEARIIVVADKFDSAETYSLLQMGAKGLLTFSVAQEQLPSALPLVASGGFWVPRAVLSGFVDSILGGTQSRRLKVDSSTELSRREQEVLSSLLENMSNKEIGNKLNISERTVKFHVSNLLSKFGVRRRADLILLCYQKRSATP